MIASSAFPQGPSLRPVFIGRLHAVSDPAWPDGVWTMPVRSTVVPGEFLFTTDGALAGLVITHAGSPALVPGGTLLQAVNELLATRRQAGDGWLGVEVQTVPQTPSSAIRRQQPGDAVGSAAAQGVMIAWVDPNGPAAGKLHVMDVIEMAGGRPVLSPEEWRARLARLQPNESIVLRVRRGDVTAEVPLTVAARPKPGGPVALGLRLRTIRGIGAQILEVADGSAAAHAGLREGDVITAIGDIHTPAASQVTEAFADAPGDRPLLAAITRGKRHVVLAIEKFTSEDVKQ
jgi:S1-C subfamily serine protease